MKPRFILTGLIAALFVPHLAVAASFNVTGNDTAAKTLNNGETGTVSTAIGDLNVSAGTTTLTVSGGSVSITNVGKIRQTGTGRAIDANTAGTSLSINNSGTISSVGGNETIRLNQTATLTLTNQVGAFITSNAADAVRPGNNSSIYNFGTISANPPNVASPAGSDGIDLRTERTGILVENSGLISGRHGIATDGANIGPSSITVRNFNGATIQALNGSGLNIDANTALSSATTVTANVTNALGGTIKGGVFSNATDADGDGIDVDGVLTLNNSGDILGLGAKGSNNPEGIAAGGGSITNTATGQIIGSSLLADAPNGDSSKFGNGILIDNSNAGNAVAATTVTNSGLIRGKSGFGIRMIGTFADTITNNAGGTIRGAGTVAASGAAIQTGGGDDTVTNRGTITGDNGSAIDLEAGNDTLEILGNGAQINGNVSGGSGTNTATLDPGASNAFSYAGSLANFNTVEVKSGTVTLSGVNDYTGTTKLTGGTLLLAGVNRLNAGSSLLLNGGTLEISAGVVANGLTLGNLTLTDSSSLDLDFSSVTFNGFGGYTAGKTLTIVDYNASSSPTFALRFLGDLTADVSLLALKNATTINGLGAEFAFDGTYTNVIAAVPEPSTTLVGLALLGLAGRRDRRCRAS